ncbi:HAMP domain-containing protein [Amycolatopsis balhimycina DSM 5908]|uniref:HAMP domain-containing protein n=1 Tax=Amycolatopsis balhimycina DSM 5908 TaxID=1081091 RepID=A0A428WBL4_AMYBA|nr:HAMP domain-containing protein [Amycolatopsis balhimycina]RSM40354.1 HAMP domain-containing protein [Amycolatopsis balhimycina DSM 5908]
MTTRTDGNHAQNRHAPVPRTAPAAESRPRRHFPLALLTWGLGATLFLGTAGTVATAPSSWLVDPIPESVAAEQQTRTALAARQLQHSLDSGVSDLNAVAAGIRVLKDAETPSKLLSQLMSARDRYRGVAYLSPTGEVRAKAGEDVDAAAMKTADKPALAVGPPQGVSPRVFVSAPVTGAKAGRLVAEFKPDALIKPLSLAGPGNTRLLNSDRKVIGATTGFTAFEPLSRPDLEQAAKDAAGGPGHALREVDGERHAVSWAPVTSTQPTRQTGLTVVTDRSESALTLSHSDEKRELILLGALIAVLTIVVFGWLYVVIVGPLSALARAAGRITRGDTDDPVIVRRYDQLGLIARNLERVRRELIRRNR